MKARVFCGAPGHRRDGQIDALILETWGRSLLVVPTQQVAFDRAERLMFRQDGPGLWGEPALTFGGFVRRILAAERDPALRPFTLTDTERRLVLQQAVAICHERGELAEAGAAVDTEGFLNHLQRVIENLKQAAVEPEIFRERLGKRRRWSRYDGLVAAVYAAYQDILQTQGVFDEIGLYWIADLLCRERASRSLRGIERICFDGFDDFTPSEFRLLESLVGQVPELVFVLHMDNAPERADLFPIQRRTLDHLGQRLNATITWLESEPPRTYAQYAAHYLLWRGEVTDTERRKLVPNLTIQACAGSMQEIETIGRAVKGLLRQGVPADQIAVVYRDMEAVGPALNAVFREFGVPSTMNFEQPLAASATGSTVLAFFDAISEWDRAAVAALWTTPFFRPAALWDSPLLDAVPTLARLGEIIRGRGDWGRSIDWLKTQLSHVETNEADYHLARQLRRMPAIEAALGATADSLKHLEELDDLIPQQGSWAEMVHALDTLLHTCRFETVIERLPEEQRPAEQAAMKTLRSLLAALHAGYQGEDSVLSRTRFITELRRHLQRTRFRVPSRRDGVACLDVSRIRGLRFDYLFLGGVNEGLFPRPPGISAFYSDEDIDDLTAAGVPLDSRRVRSDREVGLFHQVLLAAEKGLHITWRTISREGREAKPSPLVAELFRLFPDAAVESPPAQSFVPEGSGLASARDLRNFVQTHDPAMGRQDILAPLMHGATRGASIEIRRYGTEPFDAFDGVLTDDTIKTQLASRFDEGHVYSVDQIETYIACPFRFFARRVLGIEAIEEADESFSALERGDIAHAVLERFHCHFVRTPLRDIDAEEAEREMSRILDDEFERRMGGKTRALQAVLRAEKDHMKRTLNRYLRIERQYEDGKSCWQPAWFEVAFGRAGARAAEPPGNPEPFALDTDAGVVRFSGRIDRIDVNTNRCAIIDYKTGKGSIPSQAAIKRGDAVQLPVYILAVNQHLNITETCTEARFLLVGGKVQSARLTEDMTKDGWQVSLDTARTRIAACVNAIREGLFPPTPAKDTTCSYCAFQRACRHEKARIERKTGRETQVDGDAGEDG